MVRVAQDLEAAVLDNFWYADTVDELLAPLPRPVVEVFCRCDAMWPSNVSAFETDILDMPTTSAPRSCNARHSSARSCRYRCSVL